MVVNHPAPVPGSLRKAAARLRIVGVLVLALGLGGAGLVYWTGTSPQESSSDLNTARNSKIVARDIEINVGKTGLLMSDLLNDLKDPVTQAAIIVTVSILAASGCFYFAHLLARADEFKHLND